MTLDVQGVNVVRRFAERVSDNSAQSLELIRAIDRTVDWLSALQDFANGEFKSAERFVRLIQDSDISVEIDPDGLVCTNLEEAVKLLERLVEILERKKQAAHDDPLLEGENEECVIDEYDKTIALHSDLCEALVDLCSVIRTHDAELEEVVGPFDDAEDLIAYLKA